jgi:hypothetical protein
VGDRSLERLGDIRYDALDDRSAAILYSAAAEAAPRETRPLCSLAAMQAQSGDCREARQSLQQAEARARITKPDKRDLEQLRNAAFAVQLCEPAR